MRRTRGPVEPGSTVDRRTLTTVAGDQVAVPDPDRLVHLQFRRFAGCPVCNLHLRSVVRRHREIVAAGVREVVVFHSPAEELAPHTAELPFAVVADPARLLYADFGVERSSRALLDPRVWGPITRAVLSGAWNVVRGRERLPSTSPHGGRLGLPADFLVAPDGRVLAAKYGEHAYDQWPVDELLELAARTDTRPTGRAAEAEAEGR
ncbi:peroxiredoxin-like family protein [Streptomyces sp. NPDC018610]|uniref:peroxiredoxin-like family protein n=1 Tax=Streptomyces sp. NPDC018610 TaxID=3365049 RepID=UPI0037AE6971